MFTRRRGFRAFLPRFRACFGRLRVCRAVARCAVSVLTPFFARLRRFFARLVYLFKAIKKARFWGYFQGVFGFVRSGVMRSPPLERLPVEKIKKGKAFKPYPVERVFILLFLEVERSRALRLASSICNRAFRRILANYNQ